MDGVKVCTKCGVEKELAEFRINRLAKDGRRSSCKRCSCLIKNEYRRLNHEAAIEQDRVYREKIKIQDGWKERRKKYYQTYMGKHRERRLERRKEKMKEYRAKNIEAIRQAVRDRYNAYKKNPEFIEKCRKKDKARVDEMTDSYVRMFIKRFKRADIEETPEIRDMFRLRIMAKRTLKEIRELKKGMEASE